MNTTENKSETKPERKSNRSKRIILMGRSEMAGKLVPTDWGYFETIGAAELFGRSKIKTIPWAVGEEITKKDALGNIMDITYESVSATYNSRSFSEF